MCEQILYLLLLLSSHINGCDDPFLIQEIGIIHVLLNKKKDNIINSYA